MKTERRHELQTNVLADYLGKHLQQIRPYSRHISIGIALILIAVLAGLYISNRRAAERGAGWSDFAVAFATTDADALEEVANLHQGSPAALWALQSAGDIKVGMGTGQLFTDREEAEESLKDAKEHFLAVENDAAGHPQLVERARYGLGQVYEALSDVEKAQKYYGEVAKSSPNSALGKVAKQRFDRLSEEPVQRWYAWFERQEPVPPAMPPGGLGGEPKVPSNLDMLPERPDISFPESGIAKDLMDIDLDSPLGKEPLGPAPSEPKETPAAGDDDEESAAPEAEGTPKPDDSASEPVSADEGMEPDAEAKTDAKVPASKTEKPAPADTAKPAASDESDKDAEEPASKTEKPAPADAAKPAVSEEDATKPESKDASS